MALELINDTDTFKNWKDKTNAIIGEYGGDIINKIPYKKGAVKEEPGSMGCVVLSNMGVFDIDTVGDTNGYLEIDFLIADFSRPETSLNGDIDATVKMFNRGENSSSLINISASLDPTRQPAWHNVSAFASNTSVVNEIRAAFRTYPNGMKVIAILFGNETSTWNNPNYSVVSCTIRTDPVKIEYIMHVDLSEVFACHIIDSLDDPSLSDISNISINPYIFPISANAGSDVSPIYLLRGQFTPSTRTVGSSSGLMYMNRGAFTESRDNIGNESKPVYLLNGRITQSDATIGNESKPVYISDGTIKQCSDISAIKWGDSKKTISNRPPEEDFGSDGDFWFQYESEE